MEDLIKLQTKIWEHYEKGGDSAPVAADKVGGENSGKFGFVNMKFRKRNSRLNFSSCIVSISLFIRSQRRGIS